MTNNTRVFCNNCGKTGHYFHNCKHPITSIGIIAFRLGERGIEYLTIRRKDSLGFVEFMRGRYQVKNKLYLMNIIDEMTIQEKQSLLDKSFEELWCHLWGNNNMSFQYRAEMKSSRDKMNMLKEGIVTSKTKYSLASLIKDSITKWTEPEWGFPKGRREYKEKDLSCAIREFEEETGYSRRKLLVANNIIPLEEIFTGSNYKSYRHKYFVGKIMSGVVPDNEFQTSEVSLLKWKTYEEVTESIRPYNLEKKDVIFRVKEILENFTLYT